MPAKIRLKRIGRRGQPSYRVVVVDEDKSRNSQVIQELGFFNPIEDKFDIDTAQALDWLKKGAQPTPTTRDMLSKLGVMRQWHEIRQGHEPTETVATKSPAPESAPAKTADEDTAAKAAVAESTPVETTKENTDAEAIVAKSAPTETTDEA